MAMYNQGNSDALLMSMHKRKIQQPQYQNVLHSVSPDGRNSKQRFNPSTQPQISVSPSQSPSGRKSTDSHVLDKVGRKQELSTELRSRFGPDARQLTVKQYGQPEPDPRQPRLIENVLSQRTKDHTRKQESYSMHLRRLNEERDRLIQDRERLEKQKKELAVGQYYETSHFPAGGSSDWASANDQALPLGGARVHDVHSLIHITNQNLPSQIARYERLKAAHERRKQYLEQPYNGELGLQSYHSWQRDHYFLARSVVEEVVDRFLSLYFRDLPPNLSSSQTQALLDEEDQYLRKNNQALTKSKATQLVMEEIILEMTGSLAREVARETRNYYAYTKNKTDMHLMRQAEAVAMNQASGREEDDPAYQLITKGFLARQKERNRLRKELWVHSQHQHMAEKQEEEEDEDEDVELLRFDHITPVDLRTYTPAPTDSYRDKVNKKHFLTYILDSKKYWKKLQAEVRVISLADRCKGVTTASLSWDHRFLAVGTRHGDVVVYDLHTLPYRPVKLLCNILKYNDPVDNIAWSFDGRKIITTNVTGGTVKAWTWQPPSKQSVAVTKEDMRVMDFKQDENSLSPEMMGNVLDLDVDRFDTKFQSGHFAELELHKSVYGPAMSVFFPTFTLLGSQNSACIALDNGDILKCDLEDNYRENMIGQQPSNEQTGTAPVTFSQDVPKIYKPKIPALDGPSTIGQGVPVELLRQHKCPLVHMGFVENTRNMVSVDTKGYIFIWRYHGRYRSSYGYYEPMKKYRLDMSKTMYTPMSSSKPDLIFTDKIKPGKRSKTRQQLAQERKAAEEKITGLELIDPWHRQMSGSQGLITNIYAPKEEVSDSGAIFHVIIRRAEQNQLSTYLTRIYRPLKLKSSKLIGCRATPDGKSLVFCLLFPEYPPKEAQLSVVMVDLTSMTMADWRREVPVGKPGLYDRILAEDIISFDVSRVYGPTGSAYVILNIAGELRGYSLLTGVELLRSTDPKEQAKPFSACSIVDKKFNLADSAHVLIAGVQGKLNIITYSNGLKEKSKKSNHNQIHVVALNDTNTDEERLNMWNTFTAWPPHPELPPHSMQIDPAGFAVEDARHPAALVKQVVMDLVDQIIQSKFGAYQPDVVDTQEELDEVRNYKEMQTEVEGRRTPVDPLETFGEDEQQLN